MNTAYSEHHKGLTARAAYKIHDRATGEDLVQTTFLKTWAYLVRGGKIDLMKAFLYHVLNGLIIDEYRRHKPVSLDTMIKNGFEPLFDTQERQISILEGKAILLKIDSLPKKYQTVITLRYVEGLSIEEISKLTNLSKNTIAVQTHRGLEKLKILYNTPQAKVV